MGNKAEPTGENRLQQSRFIAAYIEHGDKERAYHEAGYDGDAKQGAIQILRRPYVQAELSRIAAAVNDSILAKTVEQTVDKLATREGLSAWLVGVIQGKETESWFTKDGEELAKPASMKDRVAAAKLLASIQGMMAPIKVETTSQAEVFVFHTVDNKRAVTIAENVTVVKDGGDTD